MLFTTLATKDCILLTAQNDPCDVFATTHNRRGGGAIRRRGHPSVFPILARKSSSSQSQANDSTQQTNENEIRIHRQRHHRIAVDRSIRTNTASAATSAAT